MPRPTIKRSRLAIAAEKDIAEMKENERAFGDRIIKQLTVIDDEVGRGNKAVDAALVEIEAAWCDMMGNTQALLEKAWNYQR